MVDHVNFVDKYMYLNTLQFRANSNLMIDFHRWGTLLTQPQLYLSVFFVYSGICNLISFLCYSNYYDILVIAMIFHNLNAAINKTRVHQIWKVEKKTLR